MENDVTFNYVKLFLDTVLSWQVLLMGVVVLLWNSRSFASEIPKYVSKFKFGDLEIELREIKRELSETKESVAVLENELSEERAQFNTIVASFDPHAPISELEEARQALRALAPGLSDLQPVLEGLNQGATAEKLYAAAQVLRSRPDIAHFDQLVDCIERIGKSVELEGYRLHTVWTLTSALHKMLINEVKHVARPRLTLDQLRRADESLAMLERNPRVLLDRPDDPRQGIRGPAKWARDWIVRAREKLAAPYP